MVKNSNHVITLAACVVALPTLFPESALGELKLSFGAQAGQEPALELGGNGPSGVLRPLAPEPHPYTTERGRVQLEIEPLSYAYNRRNPDDERVRTRTWSVPLVLKYGLTDNIDVQVGIDAFISERENNRETGERDTTRGIGDLLIRTKINLWGNDDDQDTALAIMPFIEIPTSTNELGISRVQGGVMVPFEWKFADSWDLALVPHLAAIRDDDERRYEMEYGLLTTLTREIVEGLEMFVEFEAVDDTGGDPWAASINTGVTIELTENTVIEFGVGFGITRAADDFTAQIALVQRF